MEARLSTTPRSHRLAQGLARPLLLLAPRGPTTVEPAVGAMAPVRGQSARVLGFPTDRPDPQPPTGRKSDSMRRSTLAAHCAVAPAIRQDSSDIIEWRPPHIFAILVAAPWDDRCPPLFGGHKSSPSHVNPPFLGLSDCSIFEGPVEQRGETNKTPLRCVP